jgi:hypothetical protein
MIHSQTSIDEKVLKKVYEDREQDIVLYEYKPSLLAPFYRNMEAMKFVRRVRLVDESNIPSIKLVEKMGFEKVGEVKVLGLKHKLVLSENGTCIMYCI